MKRNLISLIFELLNYSPTVIISKQKLTLIDESNQTLKLAKQNSLDMAKNPANTEYGILLIINVRIGPSVTVYWLGGPSVSDVLQWDWIFVEARLKQ
jgi:hypothetical protein